MGVKSYCDAVAASESFLTDAGEAIGQAGQREGGAVRSKAARPMKVSPSGRLVSATEAQSSKVHSPMLVIPSGRLVSARQEQYMRRRSSRCW